MKLFHSYLKAQKKVNKNLAFLNPFVFINIIHIQYSKETQNLRPSLFVYRTL